jgi:micrococcal nuclease
VASDLAKSSPILPRLWLLLLAAALAPSAIPARAQPADRIPVSVEHVVDGDTVDVWYMSRAVDRLRLIGIDTPETHDPRKPVRCFGPEAAARTAELALLKRDAWLELDVQDRDRYGRLLGYLWVDGQNLSVRLAAEGYATQLTIPPNVKYAEEIAAAEAVAREQGLGLWADCGGPGVPPTDYEEPAPESGGDVAPPGRGQPNDTQKHPTGVARMNTAVPMRMP